jgi:hypothetical protein
VLACLLLVGIAIVAQAFHLHPNELANNAKHCNVCQIGHAPFHAASTAHVVFGLTTGIFQNFYVQPDPKPVLEVFSLFCRPPPLV